MASLLIYKITFVLFQDISWSHLRLNLFLDASKSTSSHKFRDSRLNHFTFLSLLNHLFMGLKFAGGYPPMSIILDPKQANPDMPFLPALDYKQMNGLGLDEIEDDTFDCVLVKGTVDAMLCAGHAGRENALLLLAEAYRVLKPTGLFICIRYRRRLFFLFVWPTNTS